MIGEIQTNPPVDTYNSQGWDSYELDTCIAQRQQWLEALKFVGFRNTFLFEIPLPHMEPGLSNLVAKVQEFIDTGHYKDAVMQCRHIIEKIENIRDDKQLSIVANKKSQTKDEREDMTAVEGMLSMRLQIKNVCHLGAHGNESFTRSQAKAVLGLTLALLAEPTVGFFNSLGTREVGEL